MTDPTDRPDLNINDALPDLILRKSGLSQEKALELAEAIRRATLDSEATIERCLANHDAIGAANAKRWRNAFYGVRDSDLPSLADMKGCLASPAPVAGQGDQPEAYDPPPPDMSLDEQVRHARGFAQGICRNDHHVSRLLEQMARSIEGLRAQPAEPSERELPQWAIDEAYAIVCELPWGWEENASDELTPDEAWHQMELAKRIARHWRPAVPDDAALPSEEFCCRALPTGDPPQECDFPFCGCSRVASEAVESLRECGWLDREEAAALRKRCEELATDDRGLGDQLAQARAWAALFSVLGEIGIDSFPSSDGTGRTRAIEYVRHLSALAANGFAAKDELAALRAERDRLRERLDRLRAAFS
jgi:hypothetical protein